jgi:5S rRNA maturation endonuclease (ribonuclease M5)
MSWLGEAKAASIPCVAAEAGLSVQRDGIRPCPACGAVRRGGKDSRPACHAYGSRKDTFKCWACGANGDAIDLVSFVLWSRGFTDIDKDSRYAVRSWFEEAGLVQPRAGFRRGSSGPVLTARKPAPGPTETELDKLAVMALWQASARISATRDAKSVAFLKGRGLSPAVLDVLDIARILPHPKAYTLWPLFWPAGRALRYRIATLAYDCDGAVAGIHARTPLPVSPKTMWHSGRSKGLFFCNPEARRFLAQKTTEATIAVVVEGITDFWSASSACYDSGSRWMVFGCTSGSFSLIRDLRLPASVAVVVATDPDKTGDRYAREVVQALPEHRVVRLNLAGLGAAHVAV